MDRHHYFMARDSIFLFTKAISRRKKNLPILRYWSIMDQSKVVELMWIAPNIRPKSSSHVSNSSLDLCWIDEAGSQHRRKLINTHAQKRSRLLKRLHKAPPPNGEISKAEDLEGLVQLLKPSPITSISKAKSSPSGRMRSFKLGERASIGPSSRIFTSLPESLMAGFDSLVVSSTAMTAQAGDLLNFAKTLALGTETISSHWGRSCVESLGLSWSLSCPLRLLNLLERTSAYIDTAERRESSPRTIFWRHTVIRRLAALISDPDTRYGGEVLYGIISLLHGYLHRWVGRGHLMPTERAHSAGLRNFVSYHGGWSKMNLPSQLEQFVRMSLIMTSRKLALYLDELRMDDEGEKLVQEWHGEVRQAMFQLKEMSTWASECSQHSCATPSSLLADIKELLAREAVSLCDYCHRIFILVWLGLTKWHARANILQYNDMILGLVERFGSLPYRDLQDVSWAIVSSGLGDQRSCWQTIEMLKVFHRTTSPTQKRVCQWLFDFIFETWTRGRDGTIGAVCDQIWRDAGEGLPTMPGIHS